MPLRILKVGQLSSHQLCICLWPPGLDHTIKKGVKTNLTALGKEFEIDVDYNNLHDAVNDLILNIKVWDKLKWQIEI